MRRPPPRPSTDLLSRLRRASWRWSSCTRVARKASKSLGVLLSSGRRRTERLQRRSVWNRLLLCPATGRIAHRRDAAALTTALPTNPTAQLAGSARVLLVIPSMGRRARWIGRVLLPFYRPACCPWRSPLPASGGGVLFGRRSDSRLEPGSTVDAIVSRTLPPAHECTHMRSPGPVVGVRLKRPRTCRGASA